jgi:hypothetical protein
MIFADSKALKMSLIPLAGQWHIDRWYFHAQRFAAQQH